MKSLIDVPSGIAVFVPESRADRILLFHLMNCTDLTRFDSYLKVESAEEMTPELGVSFEQFNGYIEETDEINAMLARLPVDREACVPVDREACVPVVQGRLIGFNRDSSHEGYRFKRQPD